MLVMTHASVHEHTSGAGGFMKLAKAARQEDEYKHVK